MKRTAYIGFLLAELFCIAIFFLMPSLSGSLSSVLAFPLEQIGLGLRYLSLSGGAGNALAVALYVLIALLPVSAALLLRRRRALRAEDSLLLILSATLFGIMYLMVNPGLIPGLMGSAAGQTVGKAVLGGTVYSLLCGYCVLRVLRLFSLGDSAALLRYMAVLLAVLNALFVYMIFGAGVDSLIRSIRDLRASNTGSEHLLSLSYFFLVLQFLLDSLPYALDIVIVFSALRLLDLLRLNRYSAEALAAAERMSRLCTRALAVLVLANAAFNLLQLVFSGRLMRINSSLQIPVLSIFFVLAVLLVSRFIAENKQLKDDNDLFV